MTAGKFIAAAGSNIAYAAKATTLDAIAHPPKYFIDFIKNSKKEWQEEYVDKNVKNPRLKFGFYKTLEVVVKFFIKVSESLILYPVAGIIGGLLGGKKGAEEGQKISGDVVEGLWNAACWIGEAISDCVIQVGSSVKDTYMQIGDDWKIFKGEWADTSGFLPTTAKVIEGVAHLPIKLVVWQLLNPKPTDIFKGVIKLIEYPAYYVLGSLGSLIGGEEGAKRGQKIAESIGKGIWDGICTVGKHVGYATKAILYDGFVHVADDMTQVNKSRRIEQLIKKKQ